MLEAHHPKRQESLAEYYYRINKHLIGACKVAEYEPASRRFRIINETLNVNITKNSTKNCIFQNIKWSKTA
jgi:hypothetical protein